MPHREVFRENSSSTKTRVVYDASSKQGNNLSLNECLISGENLNPILINVVLKFREHKIGFYGDIVRAFLQIQVAEIDRNYLCFLYYDNCDRTQPVTMYHFNRHCFGVTCSPFSLSLVLAATIKTHINDYKIKYPEAYEMLNESLYVDDLFFGSSTVQETFKLSSEAVLILKEASMNMRKFDTNSEELKNLWRSSNSLIEINENSDSYIKVLGLVWNNSDDTLGLDLRSLFSNLNNKECTKRNVLHTAAKLFDPSGFVSPFLIRIKCLLQELWQLGVGWDEVVSGQVGENWSAWCKEIEHLQNLKIPRYYYSPINLINRNDLQSYMYFQMLRQNLLELWPT
ncbi:integrase catalytic domain-containing protein [Trichonephila clavipes]|nr:integrase catalytic domain-containing protein [Trichonephila clavipes]